jgi:hypothetical protein
VFIFTIGGEQAESETGITRPEINLPKMCCDNGIRRYARVESGKGKVESW